MIFAYTSVLTLVDFYHLFTNGKRLQRMLKAFSVILACPFLWILTFQECFEEPA